MDAGARCVRCSQEKTSDRDASRDVIVNTKADNSTRRYRTKRTRGSEMRGNREGNGARRVAAAPFPETEREVEVVGRQYAAA